MQVISGLYLRFFVDLAYINHAKETSLSTRRKVLKDN